MDQVSSPILLLPLVPCVGGAWGLVFALALGLGLVPRARAEGLGGAREGRQEGGEDVGL